jgi:hypothetical protein
MSWTNKIRRADPKKERPEHPRVGVDGSMGARAAFLLGQEGDDGLLPGRDIVTGGGGKVVRLHRRRLDWEWTPTSITPRAAECNTMPGSWRAS